MLQRKVEDLLLKWKNTEGHNPLVIKGCRQCGKTFSVLKFARENYKNVIALDFYRNPNYGAVFSGSLETDELCMRLSAMFGTSAKFEAGKTVIVLDEIQECPEARTALKFFKLDGRFDVIATGSLLGVSGYGTPKPIPVGYESIIEMRPLDFEEFLWANGITPDIVDYLRNCMENVTPVQEAIHLRMRELLLQYMITGGMPRAVETFVNTLLPGEVLKLQREIVHDYRDDMVKYAFGNDKAKIRDCFDSIPSQLAKENKKFIYSLVQKNAGSSKFAGAIQWIEDAGIVSRCYNLSAFELPFSGNADKSCFKLYVNDIGLFVSMLEDGTQADILEGKLHIYKGALYEALIADMLMKAGHKLYYYRKDSGLEIDFAVRYKGQCVPVEVKATSGNAKSLKTILAHTEKYHTELGIKLGDYNVGQAGNVITLPLYMAMFL